MEPRLQPLPREEWDDETRALLGDRTLNVFATFAHHPKLMKRWLVFGNHVLSKSTLPARDREVLVLRTGWNGIFLTNGEDRQVFSRSSPSGFLPCPRPRSVPCLPLPSGSMR